MGGREPAHLPLLDRGEELGLGRLGQEPDLVEEEGASGGGLKEPRLGASRVRERARLEAEELGLDEVLGERGAVDRLERPGHARAGVVDGPREQALAGSRLALEENRGRPPRPRLQGDQAPNLGAERDDDRALTAELAEGTGATLHPASASRPVNHAPYLPCRDPLFKLRDTPGLIHLVTTDH